MPAVLAAVVAESCCQASQPADPAGGVCQSADLGVGGGEEPPASVALGVRSPWRSVAFRGVEPDPGGEAARASSPATWLLDSAAFSAAGATIDAAANDRPGRPAGAGPRVATIATTAAAVTAPR